MGGEFSETTNFELVCSYKLKSGKNVFHNSQNFSELKLSLLVEKLGFCAISTYLIQDFIEKKIVLGDELLVLA